MENVIAPIYASGNSGLMTRKLNATGTDYAEEPKKWYSDAAGDVLVSMSATFSYEATPHASGNNPAHVTTHSEPTGTATLTLFGVEDEEWMELAGVEYDEVWGLGFAPDSKNVQFGLAYDTNISDGSKTKIFIPRCQVSGIPSISTTTNEQSGITIQKVEIPLQIFSIYYFGKRLPIYRKVNSVKNAAGYAQLKDTLIVPTSQQTGG